MKEKESYKKATIDGHEFEYYELKGGSVYDGDCRCGFNGKECPEDTYNYVVKPAGEERPLPVGWNEGNWRFLVKAPPDIDWTLPENEFNRWIGPEFEEWLEVDEWDWEQFPFAKDLEEGEEWFGVGRSLALAVENYRYRNFDFRAVYWPGRKVVAKLKTETRPLPAVLLPEGKGGFDDGSVSKGRWWGVGDSRSEAAADYTSSAKYTYFAD